MWEIIGAVFLLVIVPLWIIVHYVTRWRLAKTLTSDDEDRLTRVWRIAERMEERMDVIERILEADELGNADRDPHNRGKP